MNQTFCTICTYNFLPYVLSLHESLKQFDADIHLHVMISDSANKEELALHQKDNLFVTSYVDLCQDGLGKAIFDKYENQNPDYLRWSMKPVLTRHLLNTYDKVICADCDLNFFSNFQFLFDLLDTSSVLLTPHMRCSDPTIDPHGFQLNFLDGMYNAGFVAASKAGIPAMEYWAKCCLFHCENNSSEGYFADQRYLDILPTRFEGVESVRHRGCNVGNWNLIDCKRELVDGKVKINGEFDIVFIHFTKSLFRGIYSGADALLKPFADIYAERVKRYGGPDIWSNLTKQFEEEHRLAQKKADAEYRKTKLKRLLGLGKSE
ncbi:hypothetical protein FJ444_02300 [Aestuariibacter sp. GS-14]|uniref:hypothetical protein n=1 Tax=Aestuariibacter sp. GS-14 TaxID=2590670 RepID=UPI0011287347|nr:hypothetical protein [Aestuariibacter sp. GS-14]TPV62121.1 hypothetical protein FJ444_02300 [Aestuariibacter sp. GS-14]